MGIVNGCLSTFLLLTGNSVFAAKTNCEILLTKLINPIGYSLGIGDEIKLSADKQKPFSAAFLGQKDEHLYFSRLDNGEIVRANESESRLVKIEGGASVSARYQPLLKIERQVGPTCTASAFTNCITYLDELGGIARSTLTNLSPRQRTELLNNVHDYIGHEAVLRDNQKELLAGYGAGYIQSKKRDALLGSLDFKYSTEYSWNDDVISHLRNGKPVLLDIEVGYANAPIMRDIEGKIIDVPGGDRHLVPAAASPSGTEGNHSVLAVGIVERGWAKSKKILVLDSGTGEFSLWDTDSVRDSLIDSTSVYPQSPLRPKSIAIAPQRASYAQYEREVEELYRRRRSAERNLPNYKADIIALVKRFAEFDNSSGTFPPKLLRKAIDLGDEIIQQASAFALPNRALLRNLEVLRTRVNDGAQ